MSIENLYEQYLGRKADAGGLDYFRGQMRAGATLADVAKSIRGSAEARAYSGNALQTTAKQYLGRELETAGLASFQNAISAGASLGEAATAIANSPEAQLYAQKRQESIDLNNLELTNRSNEKIQDQISKDLDKKLGYQYAELSQRMKMFKMQQEQAEKDAIRQARQMQIAAAYGERDPADVRFSQSAAEKNRPLTAGTAGTFGRENLRIKGLNIKPSKGSSMASMASSFA